MFNYLVVLIVVTLTVSCQKGKQEVVSTTSTTKVNNKKDSLSAVSINEVSKSPLYTDDFNYLLVEGMKSIKENNSKNYDEVMKRFILSSKPTLGLSISLLMAHENHYGRAYFDVYTILTIYNSSQVDSDSDLIYYLRKSKENGHMFDKVYLGKSVIRYEDI